MQRARRGRAAHVATPARVRRPCSRWEVEETARKYAWAYRHETSGPERDAWLRAMAQIDGRVFEGGPAPNGRG